MSVTIQITKKYQSQDRTVLDTQAQIQKFFKGGLRRKIMTEKCLLIHISMCVHIKARKRCNSLSLLFFFQEDRLPFFVVLFHYSLLFLKFERVVATPVPSYPPKWQWYTCMYIMCILTCNTFSTLILSLSKVVPHLRVHLVLWL